MTKLQKDLKHNTNKAVLDALVLAENLVAALESEPDSDNFELERAKRQMISLRQAFGA